MAYNLGLHIDPSQWVDSGSLTAEEAELRSIAWWGCYMIEKYVQASTRDFICSVRETDELTRLFTVGIGRPSIIVDRDVQVPLPSICTAVDYQPWDDNSEFFADPQPFLSYSTTTFHYACRILQMVVQPLDDM